MTDTPRSRVIADAWRELGDGVRSLSNAAGLPLARTIKLVLDPLVIRPAQRPRLGHALLTDEQAAELRQRITAAADDLVATGGWFALMKKRRRERGITAGSPQDLYFQKAFELARTEGLARDDAQAVVDAALDDVHDSDRVTAADLREYLTTPAVADRVRQQIDDAWEGAMTGDEGETVSAAVVDALASGRGFDEFDDAVSALRGSASGAALRSAGEARAAGLSDLDVPNRPEVGATASKSALPAPFDRSLLERLFQQVSGLDISGTTGLSELVASEAHRSAQPWQLADEPGRVVMASALAATAGAGAAAVRLDERWRREAFVRHALRTPGATDPRAGAREAMIRRLWARLQGRELRQMPVDAAEAWDVIDGATRSVILDRRDAAKAQMGRAA
ncbi:hypothetical protein [Microbacterium gubbeenense]|uniref:hypothetical protein n=1 Tax=Microbacterium gubbeenense TaxID=159896 RepID=UPI003F972402